MDSGALRLLVAAVRYEAIDVLSFELCLPDRSELPAFAAGAHIDLQLANQMVRSYSLVNSQTERHRYVIAVHKSPKSLGGSRFMHEDLRPGAIVSVSPPRNNFRLVEDASSSIFITGGIGVTPVLCMLDRLTSLERPWVLHYCSRTRQDAAFLDQLRRLAAQGGGAIHFNFDQGRPENRLDLRAVAEMAPQDAHLYCCGPLPMLEAFEAACVSRAPELVHVEYFAAKQAPSVEGGFVVELARSKRTVEVPRGMTILDALLEIGLKVSYSCAKGICASCETRVLDGIPDHKDLVLTRAEQAGNKVMMICCSGSKTPKLVLDL
ncbi:MAG: PDR/VanB family oxidoreductase [Caldisericota bacterium]|nr:PDR/VanB family oxidoreductase [Caldisericota bacterium]